VASAAWKAWKAGQKVTFKGEEGLGQAGRIADPDVPEERNELRSEMAEMDLMPGMECEYLGVDEERMMCLIGWTDSLGNARITSIPREDFNTQFGGK
jgi:hypothetical protein